MRCRARFTRRRCSTSRSGPLSTRVDLGYILSPIGLGLLDMRPDTNPNVMTHLSYVVPMPSFDSGAPAALPIASSYPLGGQVTLSTTKWDARAAVVSAPPNRSFVLGSSSPIPALARRMSAVPAFRHVAVFASAWHTRPGCMHAAMN